MEEKEIEREVQARVKFKMEELKKSIKNTSTAYWNLAFRENSQRHAHYNEALNQVLSMIDKESSMPTPFDDMHIQNIRKYRDKAVTKIMGRFCKRGERDYYHKERILVDIIEELQENLAQ